MLIYVLRWWPSWISDRHKKHTLCRGPSNDHSWAKCSNAFSETANMIKAKLYMNVHWVVLYKFYVFCSGMKFKMAATAGLSFYVLWWRPSWISDRHKKQTICRGPSNDHSWAVWFQLSKWFQRTSANAFFSETTNIVKTKLYMNVHWTVFYNLKVFCSDMKFKMAATAGGFREEAF
jgi:hypothetical protein